MTGGGGAILRCSASPPDTCPTYDDDPIQAEVTVLSATMTVGTRQVTVLTLLGWDDLGNYTGASLTDQNFTFGGNTYDLKSIYLEGGAIRLTFDAANAGDIATEATRGKLTLHLGSDSFNLGAGTLASDQRTIGFTATGLTWAAGDSVAVKITGPHSSPNAYGYRTIWNALMTVEEDPGDPGNTFGYNTGIVRQVNQQPDGGHADRPRVNHQRVQLPLERV